MTPIRSWVAHGFRCALVRAPLWGAVNGYVQVPSITSAQAEQVEAHGGITYGPDSDGWIGLDTLHSGDIWPDSPEVLHGPRRDWDIEWTEDLVAQAVEAMAASAKAVVEQ